MMYSHKATLLARQETQDNIGAIKTETIEVKDFMCNFQPLGGDLAKKQYGYAEETTHRLFCIPQSEFLLVGSFVKISEKKYQIQYIADFGKHWEVLLKYVN